MEVGGLEAGATAVELARVAMVDEFLPEQRDIISKQRGDFPEFIPLVSGPSHP